MFKLSITIIIKK